MPLTATASVDEPSSRRALPAQPTRILTKFAGGCFFLAPLTGCARTAVIVDNPPPNTTTLVTVQHIPQTQPTDKNLIIRAQD